MIQEIVPNVVSKGVESKPLGGTSAGEMRFCDTRQDEREVEPRHLGVCNGVEGNYNKESCVSLCA